VSPDPLRKVIGFFERAVQLDPNFAPAWAQLSRAHAFFYGGSDDPTAARRAAAKGALEHALKLQPNSPETLLALGYYQYRVLRDYGVAKTTFERVNKMLPNNSDVPRALALITRGEGNWNESVAYVERGLALDPDNAQLLSQAASTYAMLRQFPTALKLYDRALDLLPNDPDLMAWKARMYQAEGNLQEAAKLLVAVHALTPSFWTLAAKITQLRLERNLGEAVRLLQARQAQYHFSSEIDKATDQGLLAFTQCLAGDIAGAKVTGEQTRNTFERLCTDRPDNAAFALWLSLSYAALGNKDSALKEAEHAIMLSKDRLERLNGEQILALIQMIFGDNSRAISTLTQLLQTPCSGWLYFPAPVTPALLRLDPIWDPLRADPAFQKLCEEKQP
jgi:serine/threonine-protein kinase